MVGAHDRGNRFGHAAEERERHGGALVSRLLLRDEAPDDFAYAVAKTLDEHRDLFQVQLVPWYYDPQTVAVSNTIPLHPGAIKYYRERGYVR